MRAFHPLKPIVFDDSDTLILGSFPSLKSFELNFYYAHPKNQFWPILSTIYGKDADDATSRIALLKSAKIALWDVISSCERINSSDSNLKNIEPNDIGGLLNSHKELKRIFFTGKTAQRYYIKYFGSLGAPSALLPSPSPAYASMSYEKKLELYRAYLTA